MPKYSKVLIPSLPIHDPLRFSLNGLKWTKVATPAFVDSLNVAPNDDFEFYKHEQIAMNGYYAEVDIWAEADDLPFENASQDYVVSAHVVEHFIDPLKVFREWSRVLKPGGVILMMVPHRDCLPTDAARPVSNLGEFIGAYEDEWTVDDNPTGQDRRGHAVNMM